MINMAIGEEGGSRPIEENPYGYGLCIRLNPEQCKALGITTPPAAGTKMSIKAFAIAKQVTEEVEVGEGEKEPEVYLELQITDMELSKASAGGNSATMLYGGE